MVCQRNDLNPGQSESLEIIIQMHPKAGLPGFGTRGVDDPRWSGEGQNAVPSARRESGPGDPERRGGVLFGAMKRESEGGVFEVKFPVPPDRIASVLDWMREVLRPDPHGTGEHGDSYLVQSVYLDTPEFDVFHKRGSYGRAKFRIRRYGTDPAIFLERKLKRTGIVRKRRVPVVADDLSSLNEKANGKAWVGSWFHHRLALRRLRPVVRMTYRRVARLGDGPEGRFRVTLDRDVRAEKVDAVQAPQPFEAEDLLGGGALLEVKFKDHLPTEVKRLLERTGLSAGPFSKYRLGVKSCGLVAEMAEGRTSSAADRETGEGYDADGTIGFGRDVVMG